MNNADIIRQEELSLNAYPALKTLVHGGWLLRLSGGKTRRINSVQPLYGGQTLSGTATDAKIAFCETVYRAHGQNVIFKCTPATPPDLIEKLKARGYHYTDEASVQVLDDLAPFARLAPIPAIARRMGVSSALEDRWLVPYLNITRHQHAIMQPSFAAIALPTGYFALYADETQGGDPLAYSYGVIEDGWLGVYGVIVQEEARGQGLAGQMMRHLLAWGATNGAHRAYLQVSVGNTSAGRLYQRLGFVEAYRYGYWQL